MPVPTSRATSRRVVGVALSAGLAAVALPLGSAGAATAAPAAAHAPARAATAVTTLVDSEHTAFNYTTKYDTGFKAVGLIANTGTVDSNSTGLTVTTFNAAGAQLSQDAIFTQNQDILPGKVGLWTLSKSAPLAGFDHLTVTGISGRTPTFSPVENFATTAAIGATPDSLGDRPVTGSVTNSDSRASGGPELFEVYRDAAGKLLFGDYTFASLPAGSQKLAAGATAPTADSYPGYAPQTAVTVQTFADALTPEDEIPFLFASAPLLATSGTKIKVTAKLSPLFANKTPLPGRTLLLQARTGKGAYVGIGKAVTDATGTASFVTVLKSKTYYQVVFPGDASYYPGLSGEYASNVAPNLSISRLSSQKRGHSFYVRGRAYGAEGDYVYLQRATGRGRYTTVAKSRVAYNGSYSFKQVLGKASYYNYKIAVSTTLFHTGGVSKSLAVKVV